jgi:hypothetical protein
MACCCCCSPNPASLKAPEPATHSHELLAVVAAVHHDGVGQPVNEQKMQQRNTGSIQHAAASAATAAAAVTV